MRDIIKWYGIKSRIPVNELNFYYNGEKINQDLTLSQINKNAVEILILVYQNKNEENEEQFLNLNCYKCPQCTVEFLKDFMINLSGEKNTKKIKSKENCDSDIIDNGIKCSKCSKVSSNIYQGKFYFCSQCDKIFCTKCQSLHKGHKNIVDYKEKYYNSPQYQNENIITYCSNCKKNFCIIYKSEYKINKLAYIEDFKQAITNGDNKSIEKIRESVDDMIDSLQKFKESLDIYKQIYQK